MDDPFGIYGDNDGDSDTEGVGNPFSDGVNEFGAQAPPPEPEVTYKIPSKSGIWNWILGNAQNIGDLFSQITGIYSETKEKLQGEKQPSLWERLSSFKTATGEFNAMPLLLIGSVGVVIYLVYKKTKKGK